MAGSERIDQIDNLTSLEITTGPLTDFTYLLNKGVDGTGTTQTARKAPKVEFLQLLRAHGLFQPEQLTMTDNFTVAAADSGRLLMLSATTAKAITLSDVGPVRVYLVNIGTANWTFAGALTTITISSGQGGWLEKLTANNWKFDSVDILNPRVIALEAWKNFLDSTYTIQKVSGYLGTDFVVYALADENGRAAFYITDAGKIILPSSRLADVDIEKTDDYIELLKDKSERIARVIYNDGASQYGLVKTAPSPWWVEWGLTDDVSGRAAILLDKAGNLHLRGNVIAAGFENVTQGQFSKDSDGVYRINGLRVKPKSSLSFFGDSLTEGAGSTGGNTYPAQCAALLGGRSYRNKGIGGTNSFSIASLYGAIPTYITLNGDGGSVPANQIPAGTTAVNVTTDTNLIKGAGVRTLAITVKGISGELRQDFDANTYTFTRATSGSVVTTVPKELITFSVSDYHEDTLIVWAGQNGGWADATARSNTLRNIRNMVRFHSPLSKKYLVLGLHLSDGQQYGVSSEWTEKSILNATLYEEFGDNFVPTMEAVLNTAGTFTDPANISTGIHLNDIGYGIIANQVYKTLNRKGW